MTRFAQCISNGHLNTLLATRRRISVQGHILVNSDTCDIVGLMYLNIVIMDESWYFHDIQNSNEINSKGSVTRLTQRIIGCEFITVHPMNYAHVAVATMVNTLRPKRNEQHFADDIFKRFFFNENVWISIKISLKFVPKGPINNIPALVQVMAWRRSGDKPLSEPMMVSLPTHICVTRPQWVKSVVLSWRVLPLYSL